MPFICTKNLTGLLLLLYKKPFYMRLYIYLLSIFFLSKVTWSYAFIDSFVFKLMRVRNQLEMPPFCSILFAYTHWKNKSTCTYLVTYIISQPRRVPIKTCTRWPCPAKRDNLKSEKEQS